MATSLSVGNFQAVIAWTFANTTGGLTASVGGNYSFQKSYAQGTGATFATLIYGTTLTISGSSTTTLDLCSTTGTPITDFYGNNILFTKIKGIFVKHATTTATGTIEVGGTFPVNSGSFMTGTTPKVVIRPGYCFMLGGDDATGYTVTDSTGDSLTIHNSDAASVSVNLAIFGE